MDWLLNLFTYFSSCSNIASTPLIMSFSPQFLLFINFFIPLIPFPFWVHFVFQHALSCLFLRFCCHPPPCTTSPSHSSSCWHHPCPSSMAKGREVSLTFWLAGSSRQLPERLRLVFVCMHACAHTCERDTSGVRSPLTTFNSCDVTNSTNYLWLLVI